MPQNAPIPPNSSQPIVEANDTVSQPFRTWTIAVNQAVRIVNTGSPEGVFEAPQYTEYIDETTPASPVRYLKMLPEIGGDRKKGWVIG